jgi:hypothetical protein
MLERFRLVGNEEARMNWKKNALTALAALSLAACGGGTPGDTDRTDGMTVTYVVSTADVPEVSADNEAPGFDLDGAPGTAATDACNDAPDFTSPITGAANVDNQLSANVIGLLAGMLDMGVAGAIEEQIAAGSFLLMMEVVDIDAFTNDTNVDVRIILGQLPAGTTMAMVGADGRLTPGQTFEQMTVLATITGAEISGGRIEVAADSLPISLAVDGMNLTLTLRQARIAADISMGGLARGEIGAQLSVTDIVTLAAMFGLGVDEMTIRGVAQPDLDPNADGSICNAISAGLTFEATTAANL